MDLLEYFDWGSVLYSRIAAFTAKKFRSPMPLDFVFELTYKDNPLSLNNDKELTYLEWQKIINQIPYYSFITLGGSNPLLKEDFSIILQSAALRTFNKVRVITDGTFMDEKIINSFIENRIMLLTVKADNKKDFALISKNLDNLIKKCKERKANIVVEIKSTVKKDNFSDLIRLYQYATNKGFEYFTLSLNNCNDLKSKDCTDVILKDKLCPEDDALDHDFNLDDFEKMYLEIRKIQKFSKTKLRIIPKFASNNSSEELDNIKKFLLNCRDKKINELYCPCSSSYSKLIINPMGDIYPCLYFKIGNIREEKLKDIINNEKCSYFRKKLNSLKILKACTTCEYLRAKGNQ